MYNVSLHLPSSTALSLIHTNATELLNATYQTLYCATETVTQCNYHLYMRCRKHLQASVYLTVGILNSDESCANIRFNITMQWSVLKLETSTWFDQLGGLPLWSLCNLESLLNSMHKECKHLEILINIAFFCMYRPYLKWHEVSSLWFGMTRWRYRLAPLLCSHSTVVIERVLKSNAMENLPFWCAFLQILQQS